MSVEDDRLAQIRHAYFVDHSGAAKALEIFNASTSIRTTGKGRRNLKNLLRHHDEKDISDRETWERDHFDYLLAYFSMVEVGCLAGYLPRRLPVSHLRIANPVLNNEHVRRYYEDHYPILLPQAHRYRTVGRELRSDPGNSQDAQTHFEQFFTLSQPIETGGEVETFLWFLDGGSRGDYDIDDTIAVLRNPHKFLQHVSARCEESPSGELNPLSASVQGFLLFVEFAPRLLVLLKESSNFPMLQSAMWHFHGYWLHQMGQHMGAEVRRALRAIKEWKTGATPNEVKLMRNQITESELARTTQEAALARLSSGRYSYVLAEGLLALAGPPSGGKFTGGFQKFDFGLEMETTIAIE